MSDDKIRAWLKRWRDDLPVAAIVELQEALGDNFASDAEWDEMALVAQIHNLAHHFGVDLGNDEAAAVATKVRGVWVTHKLGCYGTGYAPDGACLECGARPK